MANNHTRRRKVKGRGAATYLGVPHYVFRSEEFGQLDGWALKLLIELAGAYNGFNNGDLSCAWSVLKDRGWRSKGTLWNALGRLLEDGWVVVARHGNRNRCALYAITWLPVDACEGKGLEISPTTAASNLWQKSKRVPAICTSEPAMRTTDGPKGVQK